MGGLRSTSVSYAFGSGIGALVAMATWQSQLFELDSSAEIGMGQFIRANASISVGICRVAGPFQRLRRTVGIWPIRSLTSCGLPQNLELVSTFSGMECSEQCNGTS